MKMNEKHRKLTRLTLTALLAAAALAVSFLERLLTAGLPFPPGIKPGLSNIIVMFACSAVGLPCALAIALIKSGFVFLLSGAAAGFISVSGGLLSTLTMFALLKIKKSGLSFTGVSVAGAVMHNAGQLAASSAVVGSALYLSYAPVLLITGILFGLITGVILNIIMPAIINTGLYKSDF